MSSSGNDTAWYIIKERREERCEHANVWGDCVCCFEMFFTGKGWDITRHYAARYRTHEEAESAAFLIVAANGEEMGKVAVKEATWTPSEGTK